MWLSLHIGYAQDLKSVYPVELFIKSASILNPGTLQILLSTFFPLQANLTTDVSRSSFAVVQHSVMGYVLTFGAILTRE